MIQDNEFPCFIFVSLKIGGRIYSNYPGFLEWVIWVIEGLQRLHLTEYYK